MDKRIVSILGTECSILFGTKSQFPALNNCDGYTDESIKCIVIDDMAESKDDVMAKKDMNAYQKQVIRHEIVHAFLYESGLSSNTKFSDNWANNEEMVDWIALQLPKIIVACREALAL